VVEQNGDDALRCRLVDVGGGDEVSYVPGAQPQKLGLLASPELLRAAAEPHDVHGATIWRPPRRGDQIPTVIAKDGTWRPNVAACGRQVPIPQIICWRVLWDPARDD
jgi:hypothetical protein